MVNMSCSLGSAALRKRVHLEVILPAEKLPESGKFPVVWLLHGLSDDDTCWRDFTSISRYAREYGFAVVMPDAGRSFYADMACGPRYWSFISEELPELCRNLFPLSDKPEENFVAGLSMGGYGALKLALNHSERFAGVAAFSAVADIRKWIDNVVMKDAVLNHEMKMIFADRADISSKNCDLFELLEKRVNEKAKLPALFHACGEDDFLVEYNRAFRDKVNGFGLDNYTYLEEPGVHNWEFWDRNIQRALKFFKELSDNKVEKQ